MRPLSFFLLLLFPLVMHAQPDFNRLQQDWIEKLNENEGYEGMMFERGYLLYFNGEAYNNNEYYEKERTGFDLKFSTYEHKRSFMHDEYRYGSLGLLSYEGQSFVLFTGWRMVEDTWKKEIDIILTRGVEDTEVAEKTGAELDAERKEWVRLANRHDPPAHIRESYTENAVYFGNGMRSDGHEGIAKRYYYMENPDYQVDLEKKYLTKLSDYRVLEAGRYFTGSERTGNGGLYVILWEKQDAGNWKITLDFNF